MQNYMQTLEKGQPYLVLKKKTTYDERMCFSSILVYHVQRINDLEN